MYFFHLGEFWVSFLKTRANHTIKQFLQRETKNTNKIYSIKLLQYCFYNFSIKKKIIYNTAMKEIFLLVRGSHKYFEHSSFHPDLF